MPIALADVVNQAATAPVSDAYSYFHDEDVSLALAAPAAPMITTPKLPPGNYLVVATLNYYQYGTTAAMGARCVVAFGGDFDAAVRVYYLGLIHTLIAFGMGITSICNIPLLKITVD